MLVGYEHCHWCFTSRGTSTDVGEGVSSIAHHNIIEVYYVLSGSGILVTGGEVVREREIPAASEIVKELVGPSVLRTISGGESVVISEGDVAIIPAGIFTDLARS